MYILALNAQTRNHYIVEQIPFYLLRGLYAPSFLVGAFLSREPGQEWISC